MYVCMYLCMYVANIYFACESILEKVVCMYVHYVLHVHVHTVMHTCTRMHGHTCTHTHFYNVMEFSNTYLS